MRAGVVVAGGQGRRMGQPKAGIELHGVTLVDRAIATLASVGCDPVVVADSGDNGPLHGLLPAVRELTSFDVFVLACDLPLAEPVVRRLAELPAGAAIAVEPDGREQPLCARWPRAVLLETLGRIVATGERRMSALIDAIDPELVPATTEELLNVNTPADLELAAALLGRQ
jgi:molybdopterin-guanine dinucleotide biosynthesis protein A